MELLLGSVCLILALLVVGVVLRGMLRGERIMTVRNFFFGGLLIFQITSAAVSFLIGDYGEIPPADPGKSGLVYVSLVAVFLGGFLLVYGKGWFRFGLEKRMATSFPAPGGPTLVLLAFVLLGLACVFRFLLVYIPIFNILAVMIAPALASAACATVCWAWSRHMKNPAYMLATAAIVLSAFAIAIYQQFGRRDATSVMLACVWGAYHGGLKFIDWRRAALPLTGLGAGALVVIAALTASRTEKVLEMSVSDMFNRLFSANIVYGVVDIFSGQQAAPNSMWLIENRPDNSPYDTLHSAVYTITMPMPRVVWDQYFVTPKPMALGLTMVPEVGITRKSPGYNVGPGLIGHIWNDNPWLALPLYTIAIAVLIRLLDDRVTTLPDNPFAVIPAGVALGEIVAIPRGELGLFYFRTVLAVGSAIVAMWLLAKLLAASGVPIRAEDGSQLLPRGPQEEDPLEDPEVAAAYTSGDGPADRE
ncbi:MAG: hypothetical protein U0637_11565 [Phycisphaerales bacterium]